MKTRSNMPLFVVECDNVKTLSNSQIDLLRCGDYLVKKDASGEHAYKVTFKSDTGMCITYHDAYCVETQSYDKIDGVWTYNSEDKTIIAEPQLENIVDKDGHPRFIEGALELGDTMPEGLTMTYGKWSLSGSHLMFVLCLTAENAIVIPDSNNLTKNIDLPQWIKDKIYAVWGTHIVRLGLSWYATDGSSQNNAVYLEKNISNIYMMITGLTLNKERYVRIQFDLLIDNE